MSIDNQNGKEDIAKEPPVRINRRCRDFFENRKVHRRQSFYEVVDDYLVEKGELPALPKDQKEGEQLGSSEEEQSSGEHQPEPGSAETH